MTNQEPAQRERLSIDPAALIRVLPQMGKLMITAKQLGATHERIGTIERVVDENGLLACLGDEHNSRVDPAAISEIIVDRTSVMGGQSYPRVDFSNRDGVVLFSVVGFGGAQPFDAVLSHFGAGEALEPAEKPERGERGEVAEDDAGAVPFKAAAASGVPVTISFARPGFHQAWQGVIEKVNPAMGFINVMRADFHLHLKAGSVASWQREELDGEVAMVAFDAAGQELGLVIGGRAEAFVAPAVVEEVVS